MKRDKWRDELSMSEISNNVFNEIGAALIKKVTLTLFV